MPRDGACKSLAASPKTKTSTTSKASISKEEALSFLDIRESSYAASCSGKSNQPFPATAGALTRSPKARNGGAEEELEEGESKDENQKLKNASASPESINSRSSPFDPTAIMTDVKEAVQNKFDEVQAEVEAQVVEPIKKRVEEEVQGAKDRIEKEAFKAVKAATEFLPNAFRKRGAMRRRTRKGVKLDFKDLRALKLTMDIIIRMKMHERLPALWFNADVFKGPGVPNNIPGAAATIIDGRVFVSECSRVPSSVISLGWLSTEYSPKQEYTPEMIRRMLDLVLSPLVDDGRGLLVSPANACRHITFPINAIYALRSKTVLDDLLYRVPGSSLTVFTPTYSNGLEEEDAAGIERGFDRSRLFMDVFVRIRPREEFAKPAIVGDRAVGGYTGGLGLDSCVIS